MSSALTQEQQQFLVDFQYDLINEQKMQSNGLFTKWDLVEGVDIPLKKMLNAPIRYVYDQNRKHVGYVLFDHYKITEDRVYKDDEYNVSLMINYHAYVDEHTGYENYDYPYTHQFLEGENHRAKDFKWIMDVELSKGVKNYTSYTWGRSWRGRKIEYLEVALMMKFCANFGLLQHLDHGVLQEYENIRYTLKKEEIQKYQKANQLALTLYLFVQYWKDHTTIDKNKYDALYWEIAVHENLTSVLQSVMIGKWKEWFYCQNHHARISEFIYFKQRYTPYYKDILRVEAYSTAQMYYLFYFDQSPESFADLNYFSHSNMVTDFERMTDREKLTFPNKKALKLFNNKDDEFLMFWFQHRRIATARHVVNESEQGENSSNDELIRKHRESRNHKSRIQWAALMYMLTYAERIDYDETASKRILTLWERLSLADLNQHGADLARCFDLIYRHHDELERRLNDEAVKAREEWANNEISVEEYETRENAIDDKRWALVSECDDYIIARDENGNLLHVGEITNRTSFNSIHRKIKAWHDRLNAASIEKMKAENKVVRYKHINPRKQKQGESLFIPLKTNIDLFKEGQDKKHCIKSYHEKILSGEYLAYQVLRGEENATLGISFVAGEPEPYQYDQCFGFRNSVVSRELRKDAELFVAKLNKRYIKKQDAA